MSDQLQYLVRQLDCVAVSADYIYIIVYQCIRLIIKKISMCVHCFPVIVSLLSLLMLVSLMPHLLCLFHMIPRVGSLHPCKGSMYIIFFLMDSCAYIMNSCLIICLSCLLGMTIKFQICTCILSYRFSDDGLQFPTSTCKAFHPSVQFGLHTLGGIRYTIFFHYPYTPCLRSQRTSTVYLTCFPIMKKLAICPSS